MNLPSGVSAVVYPMSLLVEKYHQLRAKKKAIAERHAKELEPVQQAMGALENVMLDALNKAGSNSMRTDAGTAYKSVRTSISIADPEEFRLWVESQNRPDFYENRVSKEAVENYINAGNPLPPGLKVSSDTVVNVRKS
jgi:hypothetical protein